MDTAYLTRSIITWHYGQALRDMFFIWKNFMRASFRIFSVKDLFKTLFSPWQRLQESYHGAPGTFDFHQIAAALVVNTMMRILGFFIRMIFLTFFLVVFGSIFVLGTSIFLIWILMPITLTVSFGFGVALLIF